MLPGNGNERKQTESRYLMNIGSKLYSDVIIESEELTLALNRCMAVSTIDGRLHVCENMDWVYLVHRVVKMKALTDTMKQEGFPQ